MFIADGPRTFSQAPEERHGRYASVMTTAASCRSSGAWLVFWRVRAINMALLPELWSPPNRTEKLRV